MSKTLHGSPIPEHAKYYTARRLATISWPVWMTETIRQDAHIQQLNQPNRYSRMYQKQASCRHTRTLTPMDLAHRLVSLGWWIPDLVTQKLKYITYTRVYPTKTCIKPRNLASEAKYQISYLQTMSYFFNSSNQIYIQTWVTWIWKSKGKLNRFVLRIVYLQLLIARKLHRFRGWRVEEPKSWRGAWGQLSQKTPKNIFVHCRRFMCCQIRGLLSLMIWSAFSFCR
jgi:hypothetical protein